jgi:hypothetical protein
LLPKIFPIPRVKAQNLRSPARARAGGIHDVVSRSGKWTVKLDVEAKSSVEAVYGIVFRMPRLDSGIEMRILRWLQAEVVRGFLAENLRYWRLPD